MSNSKIQRILIRSTESREDPPGSGKFYVAYKIEVYTPLKVWSLWKRYSDFDALQQQLRKRWPTTTLPAALPPKSAPSLSNLFGGSTSSNSPDVVEQRRIGLEQFLNAILKHSDDRWSLAPEWTEFLACGMHLSSSSDKVMASSSSSLNKDGRPSGSTSMHRSITSAGRLTAESWMEELDQVQSMIQELRTLLNYRNQLVADGQSANEQTMQAKRLAANVGLRLTALGDALNQQAMIENLTDAEIIRRKDLLRNLKNEKDTLNRQVAQLSGLGSSSTTEQQQVSWRTSSGQRVFGRAVETEETKHLDNQGVLQLQTDVMKEQDQQLDQMLSVIVRQKEMGRAIGDELDIQNALLRDLDERVDFTSTRLSGAGKQLKKLS